MAVSDRGARSSVLITLLLGFVVAFVVAALESRGAHIVHRFVVRWEFARAASLFALWMPPLLFSACAAAMSTHLEQGLRFSERIRPVLTPALILALLLSALELAILPGIRGSQENYESLSRMFQESLKEAEEAVEAKDIPRAQERIALCGAIDNSEAAYKALNEKIQRAFLQARQSSTSGALAPAASAPGEDAGASAYELYKKARMYFQKGDYYSAHWYAGKSLILDPGRKDARLLQAEAWEKITTSEDDAADRARAALHARKVQAYELLQSQEYLGAYRAFSELAKDAPKDPDIIHYREESLLRLSETAFFADDYRRAFAGGSVEDFAVRIGDGDLEHIIFATRIAAAGPSLFLEGFEYLQADKGGALLHITAPYAQIRGLSAAEGPIQGDESLSSIVYLRRVERETPSVATYPTYIRGHAPPLEGVLVYIPISIEDISTLLTLKQSTSQIPLFQLLSGSNLAERYGWDPNPYRRELTLRLSIPVILVILVLLGTAIGARLRSDEEPGTLRLVITLPILTFLVSLPLNAANRMGKYLLTILYAALSPAGAGAVWAALLAILLAASLLIVGRLGVHASD